MPEEEIIRANLKNTVQEWNYTNKGIHYFENFFCNHIPMNHDLNIYTDFPILQRLNFLYLYHRTILLERKISSRKPSKSNRYTNQKCYI